MNFTFKFTNNCIDIYEMNSIRVVIRKNAYLYLFITSLLGGKTYIDKQRQYFTVFPDSQNGIF